MARRILSGLEHSIEIASNQLARSDIAYHRHLAHLETLTLHGRDTVAAERISVVLKESLAHNTAWLAFLWDAQAFYSAELTRPN